MIYCSSLYNQLHLDVADRQAPCCFFDVSRNADPDFSKEVSDMSAGKWARRCEYCRLSEATSSSSPRLDFTQRVRDAGWPDGDSNRIFMLSLFIGNKCNLHCATCDAKYSTSWIKIADQFGVDQSPHVGFDTMRLDPLLPRLRDLREISIMGGEPMYQDDLSKALDYLAQQVDLSRCLLRLTTNGVTQPNESALASMSRFREVDITVSVDGLEQGYEYLRHPARWDDLVSNIDRLKNLPRVKQLRMNSTISMANVWEVDRIAEWGVRNFGINMEFNMARKGQWEVSNLPVELKRDWVRKFGSKPWNSAVLSRVNSASLDGVAWINFTQFIRRWDAQWGLDFAATFPEYHAVIKKHQLW